MAETSQLEKYNERQKFRAWHKPTEKMFGVYTFNIQDNFVFEGSLNGIYTSPTLPARYNDCILMQCTGLKDRNSKLIYDLDLLEYKNEIWKVTIDIYLGVILVSVKGLGSLVIDDVILFNSKIIGNIYENSGLLQAAEG